MKNGLTLTVDVWLSFVEMQHSVIFKIFIYQPRWVFVVVHRLSFPSSPTRDGTTVPLHWKTDS